MVLSDTKIMPPILQYCINEMIPENLGEAHHGEAHHGAAAYHKKCLTSFLNNLVGPVHKDDENIPRDDKGVPHCCQPSGDMGIFESCQKDCDEDPRYSLKRGSGVKRAELDKKGMLDPSGFKLPEGNFVKYAKYPPRPAWSTRHVKRPHGPLHQIDEPLTIWTQQERAMRQDTLGAWAADNRIGEEYPLSNWPGGVRITWKDVKSARNPDNKVYLQKESPQPHEFHEKVAKGVMDTIKEFL